MAKSGLINVKVTDYNNLIFSWWEISQSTTNNSTDIGWRLELTAGTHGRIISSVNKAWSVTIAGKKITGQKSINIYNDQTLTIWQDYQTITHGSDGTKSFDVSFSLQFDITFAGVQIGTKTGSGTFRLNAINQAKGLLLGATSVTMGKALSISVSGALADETYDIDYSFAGQDYERIATSIASSYTWTVPIDLAYLIPDAMQGIVTLRCTTRKKDDGKLVGTTTRAFYANVPEYWPSIDDVAFSEANIKVATANLGFFVQGVSKLQFMIAASGVYGSTITSIKSTYNGKTYTGASWTSAVLASVGANVFQITITDSRGRTQSGPKTVYAEAYSPPVIRRFTTARVNEYNTPDTEGKYFTSEMDYSYDSLSGKNTLTLQIDYKKDVDSTWSEAWTGRGTSYGNYSVQTDTEISTDYIYDIRLTLTDILGSKVTATTKIPSGEVILDIKGNGKGIAFFKTATKDGVEIAGQLPHCPTAIEAGKPLYGLTTPGYYVAASPSATGYGDDELPYGVSGAFSLEVRSLGEAGYVMQTLHTKWGDVWSRRVVLSDEGSVVTWYSWNPVIRQATKLLWSGSNLMNGSAKITLAAPLSAMPNGIVLVFSRYASGTAQDYLYSHHFVSKHVLNVSGLAECATVFNMATTKFDYISSKYLYIADDYIEGHADNIASGTTNGITYNNGQFALKYVFGV